MNILKKIRDSFAVNDRDLKIGTPTNLERRVHVGINDEGLLVGVPPDWEEFLKKNNIK